MIPVLETHQFGLDSIRKKNVKDINIRKKLKKVFLMKNKLKSLLESGEKICSTSLTFMERLKLRKMIFRFDGQMSLNPVGLETLWDSKLISKMSVRFKCTHRLNICNY